MLVDSHCHLDHLDLSQRAGGLDAVVADATAVGVAKLLSVAVDLDTSRQLQLLAEPWPQVFTSVGVHPLQRDPKPVPSVEELIALADHPKVVAIGETGLDNYYSEETATWQETSFINHLDAANQLQLPVIIHTREARMRTIEIMRQHASRQSVGVMHCFTETWEMAKDALDLGFYISFSGIVTFKNAESLREVARKVPDERVLVETDSPYLAPVPHRGKQNEPQYVRDVCAFVAELRGVSYDQLAATTGDNFHRLFPRAAGAV